jgi:hypothetical protein
VTLGHEADTQVGGDDGRQESPAERADRNLDELLQELRVLSIGVQVLFGFLLSFPFNAKFARLSSGQRTLYTISIAAAGLATALLVAPVAYHRLVFQRQKKAQLVQAANRIALGGIAAVGVAMITAIWLVFSVVYRGLTAPIAGTITALVFLLLWVIVPLCGRRRVS